MFPADFLAPWDHDKAHYKFFCLETKVLEKLLIFLDYEYFQRTNVFETSEGCLEYFEPRTAAPWVVRGFLKLISTSWVDIFEVLIILKAENGVLCSIYHLIWNETTFKKLFVSGCGRTQSGVGEREAAGSWKRGESEKRGRPTEESTKEIHQCSKYFEEWQKADQNRTRIWRWLSLNTSIMIFS